MGNSNSQDSPRPGLEGNHHLPPYSILCASPWGPHPNGILSQDSQMRVPKLPKLGFPWLWGLVTLCADFGLRWGLKKICSPHWELFNDMLHAACTQGNPINSWLLVVGSQIGNLTPGLSFDHNLCLKCPNGSCKSIFDIYVSRAFQCFNLMGFDPCNHSLKVWESIGIPIPKVGV
jgi:hypothetical protein